MNKEDIKVGKTYNVRVKVTAISENRFVCRPLLSGDTMSEFAPNFFNFAEAEAFYMSRPETTPPKYDPCRKFKKGDKVRVVERNGRFPYIGWKHILNQYYTVKSDEDRYHKIMLDMPEEYFHIDPAYLELVTPVEEMEPYIVRIVEAEGETEYHVEPRNNKLAFVAIYGDAHPYPKAAAEAERDRLNAEHRKEQGNE